MMSDYETLLRESMEPLQYAAFFGGLAALGLLELAIARRASGAARRQRWPANFLLTFLNIAILAALPLTGLAAAEAARQNGWGLLHHPALPAALALALGFLARSLISYGIHVAMHKLPLLWRVHRVHHSDPAMDVSTTVRFHPLEFLISVPVALAAIFLLGIPPLAIIAYEVFDAGMAVFSHANLRLPRRLERCLQWVIVTPDMHRVHHSAWQPETDSNYGATLSLWDRLFGTYRVKTDEALTVMPTGLPEFDGGEASRLGFLLVLPFRAGSGQEALAGTGGDGSEDQNRKAAF